MFEKLYYWTMDKAQSPASEKWLAGLALAESVIFPIPVDIMLLPMILADRTKAWRLATIVTAMSIIGAMIGYMIGMFLYDQVALPILEFYGYMEKFEQVKGHYLEYGALIVLIGGLSPIPFKVITISSGIVGMNPLFFFLLCFPARVPRFFVEAALLWKFGAPIKAFVEKRLTLVINGFLLVGVLGFVAIKFIG